jgi:hypothetical protein
MLERLRAVLASYPGITFEANTFLTERIDETISGYTAPVVINLYGNDLDVLDAKALELAALLREVPGAANVRVRAAYDTPGLRIALDATRLARYGVHGARRAGSGAERLRRLAVNETQARQSSRAGDGARRRRHARRRGARGRGDRGGRSRAGRYACARWRTSRRAPGATTSCIATRSACRW